MSESSAAPTRHLVLLGRWDLVVDGESIRLGGREQRLSALLALTGRRARSQVAGILWPESTDARALASLRRAVLQAQRRSPGLLRADRTSIGLDPDVRVDVDELRAAAARVGEVEPEAGLLAALVGGELLPDWYDDWVEPERERIQQQRVRAFEQLARRALDCGDPALVVDAAHAAADVEPLLEAASELAIRGHLVRGDRVSATRELERYCDVIHDELGEAPSPALVALLSPTRDAHPSPPRVPRPRARPRPSAEVCDEVRAEARPESPPPSPPVLRPPVLRPPVLRPPILRPPAPAVEVSDPSGSSARGAALRLLVAAGVVLVASLGVAGLGAGGPGDSGDPARPGVSGGLRPGAPAVTGLEGPPGGSVQPASAIRQVLVRPVAGAEGAVAFVVRATRRPARVRLEVAGPAGPDVVRSIVVRSADGQRLVVGDLAPGTYRWSVTSSSAEMVTGEVRVVAQPTVVAVAESDPDPPATPAEALATSPPTSTPTTTPTTTPPVAPTTPTPTPHQPSPTSSPTSEPTDPGTADPGLVG